MCKTAKYLRGKGAMKYFVPIGVAIALVVITVSGPVFAGPTLDAVKARGKVICGANGNRAGFSALDSKGQWKG
ncbi:MAG: hypothetical protein ACE5NJ_08605, partial [Thermodesulfobacteriota bacterium]